MPTLATFPATTHISREPIALQAAIEHSLLRLPPEPPVLLVGSEQMRKISASMVKRGPSCIACKLLRKSPIHDHPLRDCTLCPNPFTTHKQDYRSFRSKIQFPERTCYKCGCPQHVSSVAVCLLPS